MAKVGDGWDGGWMKDGERMDGGWGRWLNEWRARQGNKARQGKEGARGRGWMGERMKGGGLIFIHVVS